MRVRIIDAFTDRPFAGNPAAVILLDGEGWPDERWMRQVALEINLSETAFARRLPDDADADWGLRWFTPSLEVRLCGHATLATAHAMHTDRGESETIRFRTRSGILVTHTDDDGSITLDFPAARVYATEPPVALVEALGGKDALDGGPDDVLGTGALDDLLVVLPDEAVVRGLAPDLAAVERLSHDDDIRGLIVSAPASPGAAYDYVSRFFAPAAGIPEDPVTGSAHTALAPYWSDRLGRESLTGLQVSARSGVVHTRVRGDRVHLRGRAVTMIDGTLLHPPDAAPRRDV